jgi:hypothetical protein
MPSSARTEALADPMTPNPGIADSR